ncbi:FMN-binding protein [Gordonia soli]|uniref:FMN-binding domain-containing protein n=1 Tax=Gordonia soli NBRC 108243 TaxID=1223545 RepID=M0QHZ4_9ACTN|nr:FMN-binding protein [Gordonia soli]GAC68255.1 hypothetical protein GS4_14_00860 [Gordonia soli NBRC 108243]
MTQILTGSTAGRTGGLVVALATIGLVAGACSSETPTDTAATSAESGTESSAAGSAQTSGAASGEYRDGEYSATGRYTSPGGPQKVGVTVTLANSVITALTLDTSETRGTSKEYQGKFESGIDALVVGKKIDDLDVSKVSGSSLTSGGFNDAIEQIKSEASG